MNQLPRIMIAVGTLIAVSSASAQVYRCQSPDGKTSYSSTPCPTSHAGGQVRLTDNTLETRALREREAAALEQHAPQPWRRQPSMTADAGQQPANQHKPSYECRMAIRNANTQSDRATSKKIDAERATAAQVCGYNPWPGPTLTEIDAANRRSAAMEAQAKAKIQQEEERQRGPAIITNCDKGGCWGSDGQRYKHAAGGFVRSDGKFCPKTGGGLLSCN